MAVLLPEGAAAFGTSASAAADTDALALVTDALSPICYRMRGRQWIK